MSYQYQDKPRIDIHAQLSCVSCQQSIYADQATQDTRGQPLCQECFLKSVMARSVPTGKRRITGTNATMLQLIELLAIIGILGLLASAAIPTYFQTRDAAEANKARLDIVGSYGTDNPELATSIQIGVEDWELLFERASIVAAVAPGDQEDFEAELLEFINFDSPEEQRGAIERTIQRWQRTVTDSHRNDAGHILGSLGQLD